MDVSLLLQQFQYAIPVGIVLVCAVLVYAFGFKNAAEPPFAQLSTVVDAERKQAGKKRSTKIKEKVRIVRILIDKLRVLFHIDVNCQEKSTNVFLCTVYGNAATQKKTDGGNLAIWLCRIALVLEYTLRLQIPLHTHAGSIIS